MKKIKIYKCPKCIELKKISNLYKKKKKLLYCKNCKNYYPIFLNYPVLLTDKGDFLNFRKATLETKYRIFDYEN
jgi:uncharacterized protein YbaR (Trm112 family)